MKKLRFANETEIEISDVSSAVDAIKISIEETSVADVIESFKSNPALTSTMLYIVGADIIRGYAGYTELEKIEYVPDVIKSIDYTVTDSTTESGFAEKKVDVITVTMRKADKVKQLAATAEQLAANLDYVAMETNVEL